MSIRNERRRGAHRSQCRAASRRRCCGTSPGQPPDDSVAPGATSSGWRCGAAAAHHPQPRMEWPAAVPRVRVRDRRTGRAPTPSSVPEDCGNLSLLRREPSRSPHARRKPLGRQRQRAAEAARAAARQPRQRPTRRRPTRRQPTRRQRMTAAAAAAAAGRGCGQGGGGCGGGGAKRRVEAERERLAPAARARRPAVHRRLLRQAAGGTTPPTRRIWGSAPTR